MAEYYLWIKALHIIAVIAWMAGLLYLPRLFVYHADVEAGSAQSELFKVMERRLLRAIMNPAMIVVWITGPIMVYLNNYWTDPWFLIKAFFILILTGIHHVFARWWKDFQTDKNTKSARHFRIWNEAPTVAMIVIVIMVVVKPF